MLKIGGRIQEERINGKRNAVRWFLNVMLVIASLFISIRLSAAAEFTDIKELDTRLARSANLGDLISYAYQENPSVREVREAWQAVVENYRVVTGYPDPELSITYFPEPIETRLGPQDWNASISQRIPFPGKLSKAGEVVEAEARIARLKMDQTIRDIIVSIRESFFELQYIRKAREVAGQNLKLIDHLRKVTETSFAQNRSTLLDMVKSQSQVGQLRYDIILLEDLEKTETAMLNGLLSRHPDAPIGILQVGPISPVVFSIDEIYNLAETNQEEIKMAAVRIEQAEKQTELAQYENMPDFKIGLFYAGIGEPDVSKPPPDAGRDAFGIQAGVTLPLWFGKNKGYIARAKAETKKREAAKIARINDSRTQIRSLYFRLENANRLMMLYRNDLLPQAAKAMEIAETWFREGASSFSDFIETQSVWYNFQLSLARAQTDYDKYLARLERLVGRSVTQRKDPSAEIIEKEAR